MGLTPLLHYEFNVENFLLKIPLVVSPEFPWVVFIFIQLQIFSNFLETWSPSELFEILLFNFQIFDRFSSYCYIADIDYICFIIDRRFPSLLFRGPGLWNKRKGLSWIFLFLFLLNNQGVRGRAGKTHMSTHHTYIYHTTHTYTHSSYYTCTIYMCTRYHTRKHTYTH